MKHVLTLLNKSPHTLQELLNKTGIDDVHLKEVINMLKEEGIIKISSNGRIERA